MIPIPSRRREALLAAMPWRGGYPAWTFLLGGAAWGTACLIALLALTGGAHAQSFSFTSQSGWQNMANTDQSGSFNISDTRQIGSNNSASTLQTGSFNIAATSQVGSGYSQSIVQTGSNQSQTSFQFDNGGLTTRSGLLTGGSAWTSATVGFQTK